MSTDEMFPEPKPDRFQHESPIRAFTDWTVAGRYAIGKGFRPSVQHLAVYLDAMAWKEGWELVQILYAHEPERRTMIFRKGFVDLPAIEEIKTDDISLEDAQRQVARYRELFPEIAGMWGDGTTPCNVEYELPPLLDQTERDYRSAPSYRSVDPDGDEEHTIWTWAFSNRDMDELTRRIQRAAQLDREHAKLFFEQEKVESLVHFRTVASVASFRRALIAFPDRTILTPAEEADLPAETRLFGEETYTALRDMPEVQAVLDEDGHGLGEPAHANRIEDLKPEHVALIADDPVNPRHYGGTACAQIGERLTANCYQILKYVWRLGEKDDPCIELGKAIWYLDREIALGLPASRGEKLHARGLQRMKVVELTEGRSPLAQNIALMLWDMCYGMGTSVSWAECAQSVHSELSARKRAYECSDRGRGQQP